MKEPERAGEPDRGEDEATPTDERGTEAPDHRGDDEPTPGEDPGPQGNPAQDEEGLSHEQQDAGD